MRQELTDDFLLTRYRGGNDISYSNNATTVPAQSDDESHFYLYIEATNNQTDRGVRYVC